MVWCDGRTLEVRDVSEVIFRLRAATLPIKVNGYQIMEDDAARNLLRELLATGLYEGGRVE